MPLTGMGAGVEGTVSCASPASFAPTLYATLSLWKKSDGSVVPLWSLYPAVKTFGLPSVAAGTAVTQISAPPVNALSTVIVLPLPR